VTCIALPANDVAHVDVIVNRRYKWTWANNELAIASRNPSALASANWSKGLVLVQRRHAGAVLMDPTRAHVYMRDYHILTPTTLTLPRSSCRACLVLIEG
jgi:hypothetical protein